MFDINQILSEAPAKKCSVCLEIKKIEEFSKWIIRGKTKISSICKKCKSNYSKKYYSIPKNKNKAREYWRINKEKKLALGREHRLRKRLKIIEQYGGRCACCGENEQRFLVIDHINGGGNKHRKEFNLIGSKFYHWIEKNNYPEGYQLLCHNCNMTKGIYGLCPHQEEKNGK